MPQPVEKNVVLYIVRATSARATACIQDAEPRLCERKGKQGSRKQVIYAVKRGRLYLIRDGTGRATSNLGGLPL